MGIQGRWQITPDILEPPHKKTKTSDYSEVEGIAQLKVGINNIDTIDSEREKALKYICKGFICFEITDNKSS